MYQTLIFTSGSDSLPSHHPLSLLPNIKHIKCMMSDVSMFIHAMMISSSEYGVVLCKEHILSHCDPQKIREVFDVAIIQERCDMFYASNWMDKCELYRIVKKLDWGPYLVETQSPNGFQCVYLSQKAIMRASKFINLEKCETFGGASIGYVLHKVSQYRDICALTVTPRLLEFDIVNGRTKRTDTFKTTECQDIGEIEADQSSQKLTYPMTSFWVIFCVYLCMLIFMVITCTRKFVENMK